MSSLPESRRGLLLLLPLSLSVEEDDELASCDVSFDDNDDCGAVRFLYDVDADTDTGTDAEEVDDAAEDEQEGEAVDEWNRFQPSPENAVDDDTDSDDDDNDECCGSSGCCRYED